MCLVVVGRHPRTVVHLVVVVVVRIVIFPFVHRLAIQRTSARQVLGTVKGLSSLNVPTDVFVDALFVEFHLLCVNQPHYIYILYLTKYLTLDF